jgi:hypothetical protein
MSDPMSPLTPFQAESSRLKRVLLPRKPLVAWKPKEMNPNIASTRLRAYLPSKYMQSAGWPCELYNARNANQYQAVVFQKAYDDKEIELAQSLKTQGVKTVLDLCDNHFYNPADDPVLTKRAERLQRMLDIVDHVTISTGALAEILPPGKPYSVIDDAVDDMAISAVQHLRNKLRHRKKLRSKASDFRVVWFGNAGQRDIKHGLIDIPAILPALNAVHQNHPLSFTVISGSKPMWRDYVHAQNNTFPVHYHTWDRRFFRQLFQQFDVCVIPVSDNPFTRVKTSNRLLLSLLLGVPVIADPIPSYLEFAPYVRFGDWEANLRDYAAHPHVRQAQVDAGRQYILDTYTEERVVRQWSGLFCQLLNGSSPDCTVNEAFQEAVAL